MSDLPILPSELFDSAVVAHRASTTPHLRFQPATLRGGQILAALAGASTTFEVRIPVARRMVLARAPAGVPLGPLHPTDRGPRLGHGPPGVYRIRHELGGGYGADLYIAAIPVDAYTAIGPWTAPTVDHAAVMTAVLLDPRATPETVAAALEAPRPGFPRVFGSDVPVDLAPFGV